HLRLVLADDGVGPHRLLVYDKKKSTDPCHILELSGRPEIKEAWPDCPRNGPLRLSTLAVRFPRGSRGLRAVTVQGLLDGEGSLHLDPNHLSFSSAGEVLSTTLMYAPPHKVRLTESSVQDPIKKNRVLYDVVPLNPGLKTRYQLVLSPTEAGAHRLLEW